MLKMSFFNKNEGVDLDFDPELVMISLNSGKTASIRIASGDENNINKNLKVDLSNYSELTIHLEGFDAYDELIDSVSSDSVQYIQGKSFLKINMQGQSEQDEPDLILLADHKISIFPQKHKEGKKSFYAFPDVQEVKDEIDAIWKDVFADSLTDFMLADKEHGESPRKKKTKSPWSLTSKICLGLIIASALTFAYGFINKRNNVQSNGQETITGVYDEISKMPESDSQPISTDADISAEQEAMAEFGLEEGIKLE